MSVIDLRASAVNIKATAGADLTLTFTVTDGVDPIDVSTYTIVAEVLRGTTVVDSFAVSVAGADDNVITATLTDAETLAIGSDRGLTWQLEVDDGAEIRPWAAGEFKLYSAGVPGASSGTSFNVAVGGTINVSMSTAATLDALYARVVNHGAVAATTRPPTSGFVIWVGTVTPTNADAADLFINTDPLPAVTRVADFDSAGSAGTGVTVGGSFAATGLDVSIPDVTAGDIVQFSVSGRWKDDGDGMGFLTVYSANASAYIVTANNGVAAWAGETAQQTPVGGSTSVIADAAWIGVGGDMNVELHAKRGGTLDRTLLGNSGDPLLFQVLVFRQ